MKEARQGRYGHRDASLILIAFRHGLRASEICDLEWSQVEFGRSASLHVRRVKNGKPSVHPLRGDEIRALRELRRQFPDSGFVFATERGGPFTTDAVNRHLKRIGERAGFPCLVHAHMLRHGCGYALANKGHDTRAPSRTGSVTAPSSTLFATLSYRRHDSRTSGGEWIADRNPRFPHPASGVRFAALVHAWPRTCLPNRPIQLREQTRVERPAT